MPNVVVDGRTDLEKLQELLATGGELSEVDFKETLDLSVKRDMLHFVKDAVSMFNRYPGGYIIIGATDEGKPSEISEETDWDQFDGARLADKIAKYVDAPLRPVSARHEIDGHTYCLICFRSLENGLPVPFCKLGQFENPATGKPEIVFREGDITRRDGAQNRPIEYAQWLDVLARHDKAVREEEASRINALVDKITVALGDKGKTPPLVYGVNDDAFGASLAANFEQNETAKIIRFTNQLAMEAKRDSAAIDWLAAVATAAITYGAEEIIQRSIDTLYDIYFAMNRFGDEAELKKALLAVAAYEVGASMVLASRWDLISPFVNRKSPANGGYYYASWVRDCQVSAAGTREYGSAGSGTLISMALQNMRNHGAVLLDCPLDAEPNEDGSLDDGAETVLDLLCSFDLLYCLCVFTAGEGQAGAYPACVDFSEERVRGIEAKLFGHDERMRRKLLPNNTDDEIASGMRKLYGLISSEAMGRSRFVWGYDPSGALRDFLEKHPGD